MDRSKIIKVLLWAGLPLLCVVSLFAFKSDYLGHIITMICVWTCLAMGMNLLMGYVGELSFAQGAFFGIGAYTSALLTTRLGVSFWLALPVSGVVAALFCIPIGYPSLRTRGFYFSIITLGFSVIISEVLDNWLSLTGGSSGFRGIPPPASIFSSRTAFAYLALGIVLIIVAITHRLTSRSIGRVFVAIREDEGFASSLGFNVLNYKMLAFILAGLFSGIAGSFYSSYMGYISPASFTYWAAFQAVVIAAVGGLGTISGPIAGAALLTILPEVFRISLQFDLAMYAIVLYLIIRFRPWGLLGKRG